MWSTSSAGSVSPWAPDPLGWSRSISSPFNEVKCNSRVPSGALTWCSCYTAANKLWFVAACTGAPSAQCFSLTLKFPLRAGPRGWCWRTWAERGGAQGLSVQAGINPCLGGPTINQRGWGCLGCPGLRSQPRKAVLLNPCVRASNSCR